MLYPADFERATLASWLPRERAEMFGWTLQATDGCSRRINEVWPLSWTGETDLNTAIAQAEDWLRARGLTPCFKIAEGLTQPPGLASALAARGYAPIAPTLVMTARLSASPPQDGVTLEMSPSEAFFAPLREGASTADSEERRGALLRMPSPRIFAATPRADAVGACAITGAIASIYAMRTRSDARRKGLARSVLRALTGWAHAQGAATACFQVEDSSTPAIALYEKAGFSPLYRYVHWRAK